MKYKRIIGVILILMVLMALGACGEKESKVVARVGDKAISEKQLEQFMYFYGFMQGMDFDNAEGQELEYIRNLILEEYINIYLVYSEYEEENFQLPKEVVDEAADFVKQVADQEVAEAYMKKHKISNDFIKELYINQYYSKLYYDKLSENIPETTETEAQVYYVENQEYFAIDEVEARHILVEDRTLAEELLEKLKGGADFEKLAKEYSVCPSKENGGNLGSFERGRMVKEFEDGAFALEAGELSDVVESEFGYHIIEAIDRVNKIEEFDEVKENIFDFLKQLKIRNEFNSKIEELREKYEVEYI